MKLKLTRKLTPEERQSVEDSLNKMAKAMSAVQRCQKTQTGHEQLMEKLENRREELERKANEGDENASVALVGNEDQRRRLAVSIRSKEQEIADHVSNVRGPVLAAQAVINQICSVDFNAQVEAQLQRALAPYYGSPAKIQEVARQSDAWRAMGFFFNRIVGTSLPELEPLVTIYTAAFEKLLAGEAVWEFGETQSQPAAKAA